jgi:hypothetical protein
MTITTTPARVEGDAVVAVSMPTLGWALKRTLLAILILFVAVAGAACLLYASIEPEEAEQPAALPHSQIDGHSALHLPRRV